MRAQSKRGDRGAAAVVIALVVPIVMLLIGGLIVDVGSWYSVRAQNQNGADGAALAVAQSCARGSCDTTLAASYATTQGSNILGNSNGNFGSGGGAVRVVCGNATGLTPCSNASIPSNPCPAAPASGGYVNVQTISVNTIGLSGTLLNNRTKVAACAQARWGAPSSCGSCVPMTMSLCEWYQDTNNGTSFATAPTNGTYSTSAAPKVSPPSYLDTITERRNSAAYNVNGVNFYVSNGITDPHSPANDSAIAGSETVLLAHSSGTSGFGGSSCNTGSDNSNQTAPGQFGWLCKGAANCGGAPCTALINGITYGGSPGSPPPDCETVFVNSRNNMTPVYIPIYSQVTGGGSNTTYNLAGFAAFVVTGWANLKQSNSFNNVNTCDSIITENDSSIETGGPPWTQTACTANKIKGTDVADYCKNYVGTNGSSTQCVYGYFTKALISASDLPGGPGGNNLGATSVYLSG